MKTVSAGEILTKVLLNKVDKAAYQYGGFKVKGERKFEIVNGKPVFTLPTALIPASFIRTDIDKFVSDFKKTMNASVYNLEII